MTLKSTNLVKTLPKNCTETSKKPSDSSTRNMVLPDYIGGANTITTNCSPQVTHLQLLDSMVYQKIIKLIALHRSIVSACGTATYQLAKFLTKILQKYTGITHSFVKDSKGFSQYLRLVHIEQGEDLVSFDVSALLHQHPCSHSLRCNKPLVHWTHRGTWS